jgi:hypothetical protein
MSLLTSAKPKVKLQFCVSVPTFLLVDANDSKHLPVSVVVNIILSFYSDDSSN